MAQIHIEQENIGLLKSGSGVIPAESAVIQPIATRANLLPDAQAEVTNDEDRAPLLLWIQTDPAYDFLHTDERYRNIIRKVGLSPAW